MFVARLGSLTAWAQIHDAGVRGQGRLGGALGNRGHASEYQAPGTIHSAVEGALAVGVSERGTLVAHQVVHGRTTLVEPCALGPVICTHVCNLYLSTIRA